MKFYVPLVYDREDNMGTVYFQEGSKLYTEEEKKALEQKGVKIEKWEEVECDEKKLKDNSKVYVITKGINGIGYGGTYV